MELKISNLHIKRDVDPYHLYDLDATCEFEGDAKLEENIYKGVRITNISFDTIGAVSSEDLQDRLVMILLNNIK